MTRRIVIIGSGGHARVVADAILAARFHQPVAFLERESVGPVSVMGIPVRNEMELADMIQHEGVTGFVVGVGFNYQRVQIARRLMEQHRPLEPVAVIHPAASVSPTSTVAPGTVVFAGAVINTGCHVMGHCIINTRAVLDHDGVMEQGASLGPGATLGGGVHIGAFAAVGIGATIIHGRRIGAHAVVGAGAVVVSDLDGSVVAYGVPCRVVRQRAEDEPYL